MQVFISHANGDAQLAHHLAKILRESGIKVWDDTQILPGDNWGIKLGEALQESDAMVVLLTPNSVNSPNLNFETGYALGDKSYKGRLIPVIVAPRGVLPNEAIPWVLRKLNMVYLPDLDKDEEGFKQITQMLKEAA